jgi:RNA polymerase sigma-70 factor, ECF subfamily
MEQSAARHVSTDGEHAGNASAVRLTTEAFRVDEDDAEPQSSAAVERATRAEERRLVHRVREGDVAAFDLLVRRYYNQASAVARRLMENREDAEDLVHDAFLRALDRIETFDETRDFGPWFYRLLINLGINSRRSRSRRRTEPEPLDAESTGPSPEQETLRSEIRTRFTEALASLPERQRVIIGLFEVDGYSSVEIAAMLGVSPETVRWHVHQARHTLRIALAPIQDER